MNLFNNGGEVTNPNSHVRKLLCATAFLKGNTMKQHDLIINYLKSHKDITPMDAFRELGITKLSTRIGELKERGYNILDAWVDDVNRFGVETRYKRYILLRSKDWGEDELTNLSKEDFLARYDVTDDEYEMLHKEFQEM